MITTAAAVVGIASMLAFPIHLLVVHGVRRSR